MRLGLIGSSMAALAFSTIGMSSASATTPAKMPYLDPSLPVAQRVDDLVARLTPDEKATLLTNQSRAVPRLGIPAYNWWNEALHGVARAGYATVFPEPVGLAATFDPDAIHAMGAAIGTEARVKYNIVERSGREHHIYQGLDFWSPNINIFRDPRWGRGQETYGEDPYLTGRMGVGFVTGMQGDDPRYYRVIATAKHYAVHSGPEPTRHEVDVQVSKHDQEDTYLPAFRALVTEGKVGSVMCAYNRVNGQPACASDFLLTQTLRDDWGFKGYVVSDCDAIADIQRGHHFTQTLAQAATVSLQHGVDNDCTEYNSPLGSDDFMPYREAIDQKLISTATVDASLRRLFTARMRLGLFDPPSMVPYTQVADSELNSPAHRALALKIANESMVLLKNNGVLPVKPSVKTIAVIGPLADQIDVLLGNYNGQPFHPVTALDGIRAAFPNARIVYEPGTNFLRAAVTVPASALAGPDGQPGVTAEFWAHPDFQGAPSLSRRDGAINLDRDMTPVLDSAAMSSRWSGFVTPPESGNYEIGIAGSDATLWIDGAQVVRNEDRQKEPQMKVLPLEKGHRYAFKIEQSPGKGPVMRLVWNRVIDDPLNRAVAAARQADLVIGVAGITSALEGEEMTVNVPGFKGGDRTSLDMPAEEENLLKAVKATGKPLALVLMNGSALSVNWAQQNADAILEAWYPGEQGGNAIGQTLAGANNPSGRLPVTFYTGVDELPPFEDYAMKGRTYRYFTGKPLYPFGYGLSYTRFDYAQPKLSASSLAAGQSLGVDAEVRNTGKVAGDEVVQLYLGFPKVPGTPLKALRGFTRVHLVSGERRTVHFDLDPRGLSSVTGAGDRVVAAGDYVLTVGGGQPGTGAAGAQARFHVAETTPLKD
jgi:beta-glucosidase